MLKHNYSEIWFIGLVLEGFLYGLYSGVFAMYLHYQSSKQDTDKRHIVFYSICILYVLSVALFVTDCITNPIYQLCGTSSSTNFPIYFIQMTLFACCDFIAQFILIYRCWIVWGCNIRAVIIPLVLAFAFLVTWLTGGSSRHISSGVPVTPTWGYSITLSSLILSLTVNALVTGLIVFRILKVYREVKAVDDQILGTTGGSKHCRVMFILIESGMALFFIQLARVVAGSVESHADYYEAAFTIIAAIHEMLNGIAPTIILVRTSMGLSFHDEKPMEVEVVIGNLFLTSNHSNSVRETGDINIVGQDLNRDDDIGVDRSNDIDIVERDEHT